MQTLTTKQIKELEDKIFYSIMGNELLGLEDVSEVREEAERIVRQWMKENNITETE